MKQYLLLTASSLLLFLAGCGNTEEKPKSENDIDAARNFIRSALDGKFSEAKTFLLPDTSNLQYFDLYERNYQKTDPETTRNYRESTIHIHNVMHVNDSVTTVVYSNSYKNDRDTLKVLLKDNVWLVDLKYLFQHDQDSVQTLTIPLKDKDTLK